MNKELAIINESEYQQWLQYLCDEIDKQRLKAIMQMNAATLQHYWWLGNDIIQKQKLVMGTGTWVCSDVLILGENCELAL